MAVTEVAELMEEGARGASWQVSGGRRYQRKFRVLTNSQFDGPNTAATAVGMKYGDAYAPPNNPNEADNFAYCDSVTVDSVGDDGIEWIITCGYGWYDALTAGGGKEQNPLAMPIEVSWSLRDHEAVLEVDQNGKAVLNTAGDPFDPPVTIDDPRLVMTVVRNEPIFTLFYVLRYRNAINSDPFAGFDPFYSKVLNVQSRSQFHQEVGWYYQTTYEFEFISPKVNETGQGFRKLVLNQGMRQMSASGKPVHILLKGVPVNAPMLLDNNGKLLAPNATPVFLDFSAYPELPFSIFGFDPLAISGQRTGFMH